MGTGQGLHLLTFADARLARSTRRLVGQAARMACFDSIVGADEHDLLPDFRQRFRHVLRPDVRGFGHWVWKPQILLQRLDGLADGDVLVWADAGCHLDESGRSRLLEYAGLARDDGIGLLGFELRSGTGPTEWAAIRRWTKGDLLQRFGIGLEDPIARSPQVCGGVLLVRKGPASLRLLRTWLDVFHEDWALVDDSPSRTPDHESFVEHRHDQSVLSLLVRLEPITLLNHREIELVAPATDWSDLAGHPIQARRDRDHPRDGWRRHPASRRAAPRRWWRR